MKIDRKLRSYYPICLWVLITANSQNVSKHLIELIRLLLCALISEAFILYVFRAFPRNHQAPLKLIAGEIEDSNMPRRL